MAKRKQIEFSNFSGKFDDSEQINTRWGICFLHDMLLVQFSTMQGRSHAFESGGRGGQSPKSILGPFCLKKWEGLSLLLLLYGHKSGEGGIVHQNGFNKEILNEFSRNCKLCCDYS